MLFYCVIWCNSFPGHIMQMNHPGKAWSPYSSQGWSSSPCLTIPRWAKACWSTTRWRFPCGSSARMRASSPWRQTGWITWPSTFTAVPCWLTATSTWGAKMVRSGELPFCFQQKVSKPYNCTPSNFSPKTLRNSEGTEPKPQMGHPWFLKCDSSSWSLPYQPSLANGCHI